LLVVVVLGTGLLSCVIVAAAGEPASGLTGEIRGSVIDRTSPPHPVSGQTVRLEIIDRLFTDTTLTTTNTRGRFTFRGLPVGGIRWFRLRVVYGRVPYVAGVTLTPAAPVREVALAVFEATKSLGALRGADALAVFEPMDGALRVSVVERLTNVSDRMIVAPYDKPLVFPLPLLSAAPRGAEPIAFVDGWRDPHITADAVTDTLQIPPAGVVVSYVLGMVPRAQTATVQWRFPYGARSVQVLVEDRGIRVSGSALRADGLATERGQRYAHWTAGPVSPGDAVSMKFDGLPVRVDVWPEAVAGGLVLVLTCGLIAALQRPPRGVVPVDSPGPQARA
jgi:hypothetical protein